MEARLCSTVALRAALYPNAVRSAVHHQGTCGKHERSSQLPTSVSGKQCIGYFGAAEGQHTRITPVWNIVPHFKVGVKETPLPKVPLGTAVVRGCWHSRPTAWFSSPSQCKPCNGWISLEYSPLISACYHMLNLGTYNYT